MRTAAQSADTAFGRPILIHSTPTHRYNSNVSTVDTIRRLRGLARDFYRDPSVVHATLAACSQLGPGSSQRDVACAIFDWVRGSIHFIEDEQLLYYDLGVPFSEIDKELIISPPVLLTMPQPMGDCDCFSLLIACMCLCAGLYCYYVTVCVDRNEPGRPSHIYNQVYLADENRYMILDAGNRVPHAVAGWEGGGQDGVYCKQVWSVL